MSRKCKKKMGSKTKYCQKITLTVDFYYGKYNDQLSRKPFPLLFLLLCFMIPNEWRSSQAEVKSRFRVTSKIHFWCSLFLFEIFDHVSKSNFGAIKIYRKCNFGAVIIRTRTKSANSINLKTHLKIIGRSNERFICSYYPRELYRVIRWAESSEISRPCW